MDFNYLNLSKEIYEARKDIFLRSFHERFESAKRLVVNPEMIKKEFRLLVADLRYLLSIHKRLLDTEEKNLELIPYEVRNKVGKEILKTYGEKIFQGIHHYSTNMESVCEELTAEEHVIYKAYFQEHLLDLYTFSCNFTRRAYLKPHGYAGDYEMMNMICDDNLFQGDSLYEQCLQAFTVQSPSAIPVKNRVDLIYNMIEEVVLEKKKTKDKIRIFDVACGPSIPLQKFLTRPESDHLELFFLDQDPKAIDYLQNRLRNLKELHQKKTDFFFINLSIKDVFTSPELLTRLQDQDLIFSAGLFDYLQDDMAAMLLQALYSLLSPGGTLLIGNLCSESKGKIFQWYINDWPIFFRTKEQLLSLVPQDVTADLISEKSGFNLFLKIKK